MSHSYKTVTVFGGTGFIGRQVVRALAKDGWRIKVATRLPESAYFLKPDGYPGQIVPFACRYSDPDSIAEAVRDCDAAVNCIGILYERRRGDFQRAHVEIPTAIARACAAQNIQKLIHISAIGIDKNASLYARTKYEGEMAVQNILSDAAIFRPSVVFGEDDDFFNRFARLAQIMPALPLIGGGETRFQPVYVGDVAAAVMAGLKSPGGIFELAGPDVLPFKELYLRLFSYTGQKRKLLKIPFKMARLQARILGLFPNPVLTVDQVESLKSDAAASGQHPGLQALGIAPTPMEEILPNYLSFYRKGGRFGQ